MSNIAQKENRKHHHYAGSGLYVYDIDKLFMGRVEKYRLASAIGGVASNFHNSRFSDRLSFVQDFNTVVVVPYPHLNLINCVGMMSK